MTPTRDSNIAIFRIPSNTPSEFTLLKISFPNNLLLQKGIVIIKKN